MRHCGPGHGRRAPVEAGARGVYERTGVGGLGSVRRRDGAWGRGTHAMGRSEGGTGREGSTEAAPVAVGRAVAGDCHIGWGRLQMPWRMALARGTVAGHRLGAWK